MLLAPPIAFFGGPPGNPGHRSCGPREAEVIGIIPRCPPTTKLLLQTTEGGEPVHRRHVADAGAPGRLEIDQAYDASESLRGEGLLLVPSAFQWQAPASITADPWQPTMFYPARGVALLWEPREPSTPAALAGVLDATRARLLAMLSAPRSTTELAWALEISAGGVSQHLAALKAAGLVSAARNGRLVLYVRTELADRLVR